MKHPFVKKFHSLGGISFLTGFSLMAYELVAARLLAPTIGSSIYVWTSVIGVIIAALSIGYWLGGKLADGRKRPMDVVLLCYIAAACVLGTAVLHSSVLPWVADSFEDTRLQGVVASLLLFAPTSLVLGLIGPYLAKLNIKALETAGESVANLSALNSIGGILGTFITGFIFFSYIGSNETLFVVVLCLLLSSWLIVPKLFLLQKSIASCLLILLSLVPSPMPKNMVARIDTPSAHYDIFRLRYQDEEITGLSTGPGGLQSAVYADGRNELVFWYTNFAARLIELQQPKKVLVLGGGAFTLPNTIAESLPDTKVDVVEIDPQLETISRDYFNYADHENVRLIFEDARSYVNTADEKYDTIFVDVYGDSFVPFSLLTAEYGKRMQSLLTPDGQVIINAIAGMQGPCRELLSAIDSVYRPFLPYGYWETQSGAEARRGNYILVYSRNETAPLTMNPFPPTLGTAYSDNFMPAERIHYNCSNG